MIQHLELYVLQNLNTTTPPVSFLQLFSTRVMSLCQFGLYGFGYCLHADLFGITVGIVNFLNILVRVLKNCYKIKFDMF